MTPGGFKLAVPTGTAGRAVEDFNAMTHRRLQMVVYLIKTGNGCFLKKLLTHGLSLFTSKYCDVKTVEYHYGHGTVSDCGFLE